MDRELKAVKDSAMHYGTCETSAYSAAKEVTAPGFFLTAGSRIAVKFSNGNGAAYPTLNVHETGTKPIHYMGRQITGISGMIQKGGVYDFVYDGTNYEIIGNVGAGSDENAVIPGSDSLLFNGVAYCQIDCHPSGSSDIFWQDGDGGISGFLDNEGGSGEEHCSFDLRDVDGSFSGQPLCMDIQISGMHGLNTGTFSVCDTMSGEVLYSIRNDYNGAIAIFPSWEDDNANDGTCRTGLTLKYSGQRTSLSFEISAIWTE